MMVNDMTYNQYYLCHHGIKGQKWHIRRYQNEDGTLTEEGKKRKRRNIGIGIAVGAIGAMSAAAFIAYSKNKGVGKGITSSKNGTQESFTKELIRLLQSDGALPSQMPSQKVSKGQKFVNDLIRESKTAMKAMPENVRGGILDGIRNIPKNTRKGIAKGVYDPFKTAATAATSAWVTKHIIDKKKSKEQEANTAPQRSKKNNRNSNNRNSYKRYNKSNYRR